MYCSSSFSHFFEFSSLPSCVVLQIIPMFEANEDVESPNSLTGFSSTDADAEDVTFGEPVAMPRISSTIQRAQREDGAQRPVNKDWLLYYMLHNIGNM